MFSFLPACLPALISLYCYFVSPLLSLPQRQKCDIYILIDLRLFVSCLPNFSPSVESWIWQLLKESYQKICQILQKELSMREKIGKWQYFYDYISIAVHICIKHWHVPKTTIGVMLSPHSCHHVANITVCSEHYWWLV